MVQSVVFTLLPQDVTAGGDLRAAIFVAPQLTPDDPDATAASFPAFESWPDVVARATIVVERAGGGTIELRADPSPLRPDLWRTYLAPIAVRGWRYTDLSATELRSYDAQAIVALAEGLYHAVAEASQGEHPDPLRGGLRNLGAAYLNLVGRAETQAAIDENVDSALARRAARRRGQEAPAQPGMAPNVQPVSPADALKDAANAALDLAEARRFYDRPEARDPDAALYKAAPDPNFQPVPVDPPEPDFHDVLTALGDHPDLLRALGIVIEIELPAGFVGAGTDLRVRLEHDRLQPNPVTVQPWTRTVVDGQFFQPVSETGDLHHGMLQLDDPNRFHVAQVDVDSAALLIEQRIANVYSIADATQDKGPVEADLPALRSTGMTVTRLRRSVVLGDRIGRSKANADKIAAGQEVVLFAEDLTRGFRVDVHDGKDWRSLMRRTVRYLDRADGSEQFAADDEAYLKASSLTKTPGAAVDRSYLHESLFGWDGWSLAVPRPGRHIPHTPDAAEAVTDDVEQLDSQLALNFDTDIVAGTLPRLRYSHRYAFRARTVDLTGMSTPYAGDEHRTPADEFRRFQPVSHPTVVPCAAFTEGESTLRLVVRSGVDADNSDPASSPAVVDPATYTTTLNTVAPRTFVRFHAEAQRHLAPPKTSQQEAELLGRFDDAIGLPAGTPGAPARYREAYARARREQGTLADPVILSATDPTAPGMPAVGLHLMPPLARDGDFATQAELDALLPTERGAAPEAGFVIVHDTKQLRVPYLPDPLATGTALRFTGHGNAAGWRHLEQLSYEGVWPDLEPHRMVLVGGATPDVTVAGNVVTVTLPPGGWATVRASSAIDAAALDLLGMWDWVGDTVPAGRMADVLAGGHQMVTPGEQLTLIHATQRPLVRPALERDVKPRRAYGETFTRFRGTLRCQAATSGRLDLAGVWREWFDDPASGRPPELTEGHTGHAFDLVAEQDDLIDLATAGGGDLKHEFGDTKHRRVSYAATATTRFREYLPAVVSADVDELQVVGPERVIHVPNAARPAAPVVHAVMPTFRWSELPEDEFDPSVRARSRAGGLRVWLERPWFDSGEGELLGVVVSGGDGVLGAGDLRRQYVSLWGKDPIRVSGQLEAPLPRPRDFSGDGLVVRDRLTLSETGSRHPGVSVVGHPVRYSEARDMWFADLAVDPDEAYWPFLRLALTRFQPWSIADAELSQVAVVDFVQLTNERTAAIARPSDDVVRVTVSGITEQRSAPALSSGSGRPPLAFALPPNRGVRAWVERRGSLASDLDWHPVGDRIELPRVDEDEVMRVWSGDVPLPAPIEARRPGVDPGGESSDWRLVIAEWEALLHDEPHGEPDRIERIVYLDRFPL
jgi:hypothetical protein